MTVTPCEIYALNLQLKNVAKIEAVRRVEAKVRLLLTLFWGKEALGRKQVA